MELRPGRFARACGVCTLVPAQQPHMQSEPPVQLICLPRLKNVRSALSFAAFQHQSQLSMVRKTWVVRQSRDL